MVAAERCELDFRLPLLRTAETAEARELVAAVCCWWCSCWRETSTVASPDVKNGERRK